MCKIIYHFILFQKGGIGQGEGKGGGGKSCRRHPYPLIPLPANFSLTLPLFCAISSCKIVGNVVLCWEGGARGGVNKYVG